ncbi:guanylate cyclase 32E, partial [Biomphalaria pfeifferi]
MCSTRESHYTAVLENVHNKKPVSVPLARDCPGCLNLPTFWIVRNQIGTPGSTSVVFRNPYEVLRASIIGLLFVMVCAAASTTTPVVTSTASQSSSVLTTVSTTTPTSTPAVTTTNATTRANKTRIVLGYITSLTRPKNPELAAGPKISGAMTYAIAVINNDTSLLPGYVLAFLLGNGNNSDLTSLNLLTEQWKSGAVAFFGPEDSCEVESRVAAAWQMPILAYKCNDPVVSDKDRFPTLARTQPPASHSVRSILALISYYNWTKFSIIVEQDGLMPRAGLNLETLALSKNMTVSHFVNISGPYSVFDAAQKQAVWDAVDSTYVSTRIYVVFSRERMFAEFLKAMWERGLTNTSEYVVITVQNDTPWNESLSQSLIFQATDFAENRDNRSFELWRSVFMLINMPITNPNYTRWENSVRDYLYRPPVNLTRSVGDILLGIKVQIPVYAAYLYDSVLVYAKALHDVIAEGKTPKDGAAVFNKLRDRTFQSIQGHMVYLDDNGDAEANYTVIALQPMNNSYGHGLKPVGRFIRSIKDRKLVNFLMDVDVFGDNVPLDEPLCGYYNEWCRVPEET